MIYQGDCLTVLKTLPDESVNCCITSPPYYGLRNYKVDGQIGLEQSPDEYVQKLVNVFREVNRVLRDDGTVWLNLGDSYGGSGQVTSYDGFSRGPNSVDSRPLDMRPAVGHTKGKWHKQLLGIPWRVAFALQSDGWYLRSDIIWHKPNPMPESVKDRPTKAHEYIFLLTKKAQYYYDYEAILEPQKISSVERLKRGWNGNGDRDYPNGPQNHLQNYMGKVDIEKLPKVRGFKTKDQIENPQHHRQDIYSDKGRNRRSVWTVTTKPFKGAHFAVFPEKLIEPCVLAGCPEKVCVKCGAPYVRDVERVAGKSKECPKTQLAHEARGGSGIPIGTVGKSGGGRIDGYSITRGWKPTCSCAAETKPGVILDPFCGSGTTGVVAVKHGREFIGIELNPDYVEMAEGRIKKEEQQIRLSI